MQKASIIIVLFFICLNNGYSQDFKLAGIHYVNYPKSEIKDVSGNQETSFQEFGVFVNFPKKFKNKKTVLINGVGYGFVEATMSNFPSLQTNEYHIKLHEFYYQVALLHKWNEKWGLVVNLKPTLASDFKNKLSADDFTFQGAVIATKTFNDAFKIGGGIANTMRFGTSRVLPVINVHYKKNRHNLNALLPLNIKYTYSLLPNEKLKLGLKYALNGANFNINNTELATIDKINYSRTNIGVLANYHLTKILRLEAYGGLSTNRRYNLVDNNQNVYDFDSKTAPFFNIGLVLVAPKRK